MISSISFVCIGYKFPKKMKIIGQSNLGSFLLVLGINDFVGGFPYLQSINFVQFIKILEVTTISKTIYIVGFIIFASLSILVHTCC